MDQNLFFFIILAVFIAGFYFLWSAVKKRGEETKPDQSMLLLQNTVNELRRTLDQKLGESTHLMQTQFGESAKIIREITKELVQVNEGQKQVVNVTEQLKSLQDILKNPKQRGVLGEYYLETVLKNVFPPNGYQMQYPFKDGSIVDAVIFVGNQIVPIDSKFSLENYNRMINEHNDSERERLEKQFVGDLKARIDETSKYIKPGEDTVNFAFMFVPSEAIYYDLLINKVGAMKAVERDLIDYAYNEKHVIIVSPATFAAYLQVLFQAMRAFKIQESTEKIKKEIEKLTGHLKKYDDYMLKLGKNIGQTVSSYNSAYKEFFKIDKDILKITGESVDVEPLELEKPHDSEE
ncbi:MAG: DNA recombination protein RmuC [Candidatus Liptonbacteria bacterium]|nr:DNA recombination protein RmuC [Candidatus Liptonbacteria bacterium]